jgi:integrase
MRRKLRPGQIGDYWPDRRTNSPAWCRTWFDPATRQTRRASLGTEDFREACQLLADWYAHNVTLKRAAPEEVKLADIFVRYWEDHAKHVRSASSARVHLRVALELLDGDPLVSEFGITAQEQLIARLGKRYSPGTVKRYFASVAAAIRWAWKREIITSHRPLIERLPGGSPRERVLTIKELARLWDAADAHHLKAFIMVMLCTSCRPGAALELTRFQCDLERGFVRLNAEGREQTKKRRPVLPMPSPLRPWVDAARGPIVEFNGRPIKSVKTIWRGVRTRAGFGLDVSPMTLRHTVASEMARRGVPDFQRQCFMGHQASNTTDRNYVHVRPDFLRDAREAIEAIVSEMGEAATSPIVPINPNVRATCVLAV